MGYQPVDNDDWISKLVVYIVGTLIGITSKLITIHRESDLTMKEAVFQSSIALACAWIVWWLLQDKIPTGMAAACSVVVGRFGDSMLIAIGKALKSWILNNTNNND